MLYVIGMGIKGSESLPESSLKIIARAGLLAGGRRHLVEFPGFKGVKVPVRADLAGVGRTIGNYLKGKNKNPAVVLATGDPSLFGIADFLIKRFGKRSVRIVPNVSPVQEAFARIKENWNGARVLSVHGRGDGGNGLEALVREIKGLDRAAVFTDPVNTPVKIARALLEGSAGSESGYTVYVCEALGTKDEKIKKGTLDKISRAPRGSYNPLNVMLLIRDKKPGRRAPHYPPFGIPDKEFSRTGGMITKEEVRVVALAKLRLGKDSTVWDIGSGSGSVAIEAARIASSGSVLAVEKAKKRVKDIEANRRKFAVANLDIIPGTAPGCLKGGNLPAPDRVFIGGGGGGLPGILNYVSQRVKKGGIIVINAVSIDTLSTATAFFKRRAWKWDVVEVSIARKKTAGGARGRGGSGGRGGLDLLSAHHPVFIISARKP